MAKTSGGTGKRERYFARYIERVKQVNRDNDYIVAKGDANVMKDLKYWRQIEYYSLLDQVIKEGERQREAANKKKK
jgi:hypothetical protein